MDLVVLLTDEGMTLARQNQRVNQNINQSNRVRSVKSVSSFGFAIFRSGIEYTDGRRDALDFFDEL